MTRRIACVSVLSAGSAQAALFVDDPHMESCVMVEPFADPPPVTLFRDVREPWVPDDDDVALIERLARGIHRWKTGRDHGWWECGAVIPTGPRSEDRAIVVAYEIVRAARTYSDDKVKINVWGLAATIAHESSFDRCAVGVHFRQWAIRKKLIKPRTRTISYGRREMIRALKSPLAKGWFATTGVDVGYCQLLTRFYDGPIGDLMDPIKGIDICARQFYERAKRLRTTRPWRYWRGFNTPWYEKRIVYRARTLGARPGEI